MNIANVNVWATYLVNPAAGVDKFYRAYQIDRFAVFHHGRNHRAASGGRATVKAFASPAEARAACRDRIAAKTRNGYAHPAAHDAFPYDPHTLPSWVPFDASADDGVGAEIVPYLAGRWTSDRGQRGLPPTPRPENAVRPPPERRDPVEDEPAEELALLTDSRALLTLAIEDPPEAVLSFALLRERHTTAEAQLAETTGLLEAIGLILFATD